MWVQSHVCENIGGGAGETLLSNWWNSVNDSSNGVDISFHSTLHSRSRLELAAFAFFGEKITG